MLSCSLKYSLCLFALTLLSLRVELQAQQRPQSTLSDSPTTSNYGQSKTGPKDLDINIKGPNGTRVEEMTMVILTKATGQFYRQGVTRSGYIRFKNVARAEYIIEVVGVSYQLVVRPLDVKRKSAMEVTVELTPAVNVNDAAALAERAVLSRKAHEELRRATEALHAKTPAKARSHLEAVYRLAPNDADVNYLFGVYSSELNDWEQAKLYWIKTLRLEPKHFRSLLSLSERLVSEHKSGEALTLAQIAVEVEPTSWRGHAILASAYLQQGSGREAVFEAERALELGHQQAANVEPVLATALAKVGDSERADNVLQTYIRNHPADATAKKYLAGLQLPAQTTGETAALSLLIATSSSLVPSTWLPPDVDEKVPPVESASACVIDAVIQKAGQRVLEFVGNVDRFTATESITHQSITKWGSVSYTETHLFDYLAAISEVRPGLFDVEEYRTRHASPVEFPDGVETRGLPSMALLFHPKISDNYEITCEGMTRLSGGPAWQLHFRQRPDKPNIMRSYRVGMNGPAFPVALRGRAWIAADTYQVVRMETDLVTPVPEIRLVADHTAIEYGLVRFRERQVEMWLPLTAEVYYDWRGHRTHRRHTFNNYLLFSVDEKQQISPPKAADLLPAKE